MESVSSWAPQAKAQSPPPMAQAPKPTGEIIKSEFPSLRVCILPPDFYDERSAFAVSLRVSEQLLCAQIIGFPNLDHLLDGLAVVDFVVEYFSCERGEFGVAGEPQ